MVDAERRRWLVIAGLGTSQTLAWASSYYLIAILAPAMARDLGTSTTGVFAAFSASLLISALLGPRVGRTIDAFGGREVLAVSNLIFAAGLGLLAVAPSLAVLWLGWLVIGVGMGLGLYDAAFAALGRMYGPSARSSITGITLIAGFASTVGWPLTAWGDASLGWRITCLVWAAAHLLFGLPLNLVILPKLRTAAAKAAEAVKPHVPMDRAMWLLGFAFAAGWVVSTAMAAHLPRVLEAAGATPAEAIAASALVGPAQVAARVLEAGFLSRYHPLVSARLSTITHPIGAGLLLTLGGWFAMPFTLLHGAGNGILTIARGTVPLAVFGPENYGYRLGLIGAPARILQAGAPLAFEVLIDRYGASALVFSSLICLMAMTCLLAVSAQPNQSTSPEHAS
ncbi:MAG: MFS transporter [Hyphomicrobiaceae bacterium]